MPPPIFLVVYQGCYIENSNLRSFGFGISDNTHKPIARDNIAANLLDVNAAEELDQ